MESSIHFVNVLNGREDSLHVVYGFQWLCDVYFGLGTAFVALALLARAKGV